ncbi:FCD domain-containing protein, partial [Roseateles sp. GG27B]
HHSLFKQGRLRESLSEHRELMAALEARNPDLTQRLTIRHFENGLNATYAAPVVASTASVTQID